MNRLFWGIAFLVLAAAGGWSQSTWRGQAEVWSSATAPTEGFVAASNEFPRNTLLSVENYKTKKTIQVRVVASLPAGSSALVLLNPKAAKALDMKAGDAPLVGVRIDPSGDLAENPDPDINPMAAQPVVAATPKVTPPPVVTPTPVPAPTPTPTPAPVAKTEAPLLPLPEPVAPERTPLAVVEEPESTPVTPGRKVFLTTRESEPVAAESPVVASLPGASEPVVEPEPEPEPEPLPATTPAPAIAASEPSPSPEPSVAPEPSPVTEPVSTRTEPVAKSTAEPVEPSVAARPLPTAPATAWVNVPGKLEGSILGQIAFLSGLEKGRTYVQVGAWSTEAELLKVLESVKSHVPLALYQAEGEKNPWRVVATAPKAQLGVLLMQFRSQGFRAAVVKG